MTKQLAGRKQQFGHRARLALTPVQAELMNAQAHAARAMWNQLHVLWTMTPKCQRSPARMDHALRQARKDIDWYALLPAQAAQAVLKTYVQAWKNCWDGRAEEPTFKARFRSTMSVDIPQGRDLQITRVHRRWGMVNIPKIGRVRFRCTCTGWATRSSRLPGGQSPGAPSASSPPLQGRQESPAFSSRRRALQDNDVMAVAGVAAAAELGFSVPADVSVVAWEDSALCRMVKPWLSALSRDSVEFGRTAATELTALLDGGPARTVRVPVPRLIGRDSTGAARGG